MEKEKEEKGVEEERRVCLERCEQTKLAPLRKALEDVRKLCDEIERSLQNSLHALTPLAGLPAGGISRLSGATGVGNLGGTGVASLGGGAGVVNVKALRAECAQQMSKVHARGAQMEQERSRVTAELEALATEMHALDRSHNEQLLKERLLKDQVSSRVLYTP